MKKLISLKTQKAMLFLPLVNCFIFFAWFININRVSKDLKKIIADFFISFAFTVPCIILNILLARFFAQMDLIVALRTVIWGYLTPLSMGVGLILCQKKHFGDYFKD